MALWALCAEAHPGPARTFAHGAKEKKPKNSEIGF